MDYFDSKVTFLTQGTDGLEKEVKSYLIKADSFTEAEAIITKEVQDLGGYESIKIDAVSRKKLAEVVGVDFDRDFFYLVKLGYVSLDEKSGQEKFSFENSIFRSESFENVYKEIKDHLADSAGDVEIVSIVKQKYVDYLKLD